MAEEREQWMRLIVTSRNPADYMAARRSERTDPDDIGQADIRRQEVLAGRIAPARRPSDALVDDEGAPIIPIGAG